MTHASNQDLIAAYLEGDPAATEQIDRWIVAASRAYFRRLSHEWDDVLQDIHVEVFQLLQKGQFRGDAALKTYLWRVVSHSCLDRIRRSQRYRWTEVDDSPEIREVVERDRRNRSVSYETVDLLLRVLDRMSAECRRLWQMIVDGHSYQEMGRRLEISEGALRVRALRCRRKAIEIRESLTESARGL